MLHLVTRYFERSNTASVTFVISNYRDNLAKVADELISKIPFVNSVSYSINDPKNTLVITDKVNIIKGSKWIEDRFKEFKVKVSPDAFHQLNTIQMEKMYDSIMELVEINEKSIVFDLYSGIGITSLLFASKAKKVYGIDYSEASINDAIENAKLNNIKNVEFVQGHVESEMPKLIKSGVKPDLVVLDPPRKGLALPVIEALLKSAPKQIIYISCNPSTLAKNISELKAKYEVLSIQPIDMFPHTASVESITILIRK